MYSTLLSLSETIREGFNSLHMKHAIVKVKSVNKITHNVLKIVTEKPVKEYAIGKISSAFIQSHSDGLNKLFYLCGPPPMVEDIEKQLTDLGVITDSIVKEAF